MMVNQLFYRVVYISKKISLFKNLDMKTALLTVALDDPDPEPCHVYYCIDLMITLGYILLCILSSLWIVMKRLLSRQSPVPPPPLKEPQEVLLMDATPLSSDPMWTVWYPVESEYGEYRCHVTFYVNGLQKLFYVYSQDVEEMRDIFNTGRLPDFEVSRVYQYMLNMQMEKKPPELVGELRNRMKRGKPVPNKFIVQMKRQWIKSLTPTLAEELRNSFPVRITKPRDQMYIEDCTIEEATKVFHDISCIIVNNKCL